VEQLPAFLDCVRKKLTHQGVKVDCAVGVLEQIIGRHPFEKKWQRTFHSAQGLLQMAGGYLNMTQHKIILTREEGTAKG